MTQSNYVSCGLDRECWAGAWREREKDSDTFKGVYAYMYAWCVPFCKFLNKRQTFKYWLSFRDIGLVGMNKQKLFHDKDYMSLYFFIPWHTNPPLAPNCLHCNGSYVKSSIIYISMAVIPSVVMSYLKSLLLVLVSHFSSYRKWCQCNC